MKRRTNPSSSFSTCAGIARTAATVSSTAMDPAMIGLIVRLLVEVGLRERLVSVLLWAPIGGKRAIFDQKVEAFAGMEQAGDGAVGAHAEDNDV